VLLTTLSPPYGNLLHNPPSFSSSVYCIRKPLIEGPQYSSTDSLIQRDMMPRPHLHPPPPQPTSVSSQHSMQCNSVAISSCCSRPLRPPQQPPFNRWQLSANQFWPIIMHSILTLLSPPIFASCAQPLWLLFTFLPPHRMISTHWLIPWWFDCPHLLYCLPAPKP
jgi:hypothetical protein